MKVLIIPDVHLKPWMFVDAERLMKETGADGAVVLGDLVDDWRCQNNVGLYIRTLQAARVFAGRHPDTLWCYGNHDAAYLWDEWNTGTSANRMVRETVLSGLNALKGALAPDGLALIHRVDHVLFSHAGVSRCFVQTLFPNAYDDVDKVLEEINGLGAEEMWNDDSPLWLRPQKAYRPYPIALYKPREYLQVVGHTPMQEITREGNLLSCDVFSLHRDGTPLGSQEFCLLDMQTLKWIPLRSSGGKITADNPGNPR